MFVERYSLSTLFFVAVAATSALCWAILTVSWLASSREPGRRLVFAPVLLALAAFIPLALTFLSTTRAEFTGAAGTQFSWILISLYLFGVATVAVISSRVSSASRLNRVIFVIVTLYWLVGGLSDYYAGFALSRLSFLLVPVIFFASLKLRPGYRGAVAVVTYVTVLVCICSLILALVEPSIAFLGPSRFPASLLFAERLAGILEHPNAMGLFASLGVVLAWQRGGRTRWIGAPACGLALVASDSRGSWFACVAAIAILVAGRQSLGRPQSSASVTRASGRISGRVTTGGILIAIAAWSIVTYVLPEGSVHDFNGRTTVWTFVLQRWSDSPVIGHGPQVWLHLIATGQLPVWAGQAHNQFLQTLFTMGIVGMLILGALIVTWTLKSLHAASRGFWLPLAMEVLVVTYALFESPLSFGGVSGNLWLLSILLFLDPVDDSTAQLPREGTDDRPTVFARPPSVELKHS